MPDKEIMNHFNEKELKTNKGNSYTLCSVQWIRHKYKISSYNFRKPGELSINEVAKKFDIGHHTVRYWIETGIIDARKANGHKFWILLTPEKEEELNKKINCSLKISIARRAISQKKIEGDVL